jgi:hypothetical protein
MRGGQATAGPWVLVSKAVQQVHARGVCPPPWTSHGLKGPKMAGTLDARGTGGRSGSAPSPRTTCLQASRAYAWAVAVLRVQDRGVGSHQQMRLTPDHPESTHCQERFRNPPTLHAVAAQGPRWSPEQQT